MSNLLKTFASTIDVAAGPKVEFFPDPVIPSNTSIVADYKVYAVMTDETWRLKVNLTNGAIVDFTGVTGVMSASIFNDQTVSKLFLFLALDIRSTPADGTFYFTCPTGTLPESFANDFDWVPEGSIEIDIEFTHAGDSENLYLYDRINVVDKDFGGTGAVAPNSRNYLETADLKPPCILAAGYTAPTAGADIVQKTYADDLDAAQTAALGVHAADVANPHAVTAAQVGNDTAQWNADELKGKVINDGNIGVDRILSYDGVELTYVDNPGLPSAVQGDMLYHNGTDWTRIASGASGTILKSNGLLADPTWETVAGTGDLVGPASAVDANLMAFDGITGKLSKDALIALADVTVRGGTTQTGTDVVQQVFKGHSSQTANILEVQDSSAAVIGGFDKDGYLLNQRHNVGTSAIGASDVDWSAGGEFTKTLSANTTLTFSNVVVGQTIVLDITGASGHTLTLPGTAAPLNGGTFTADVRNVIYVFAYSASEQHVTFATI